MPPGIEESRGCAPDPGPGPSSCRGASRNPAFPLGRIDLPEMVTYFKQVVKPGAARRSAAHPGAAPDAMYLLAMTPVRIRCGDGGYRIEWRK